MRETRRFRGISKRLAVQYLENLGGERVAAGGGGEVGDEPAAGDVHLEGAGWTASLSADTVAPAGSIELSEVTVEFEGDERALADLIEDFERKAIRAGG